MKRIFLSLVLLTLLGFLIGCTNSPTEPKDNNPPNPPSDQYSLVLSPKTATALICTHTPPISTEVVELTATVKKGGETAPNGTKVIFKAYGGALFVESGTAMRSTWTSNGIAVATIYSTTQGTFAVEAYLEANQTQKDTANITFVPSTVVTITSITPTLGSIAGGDTVTITGSGFFYPLKVYFGTAEAIFISYTYTSIVVHTPPHFPAHCNLNDVVDVKVVVYPGQAAEQSATLPSAFTYLFEPLQPTISAVSPNHGLDAGGTLVTVYGTNFYCGEGVLVYFRSPTSAADVPGRVRECSPNQLLVESPAARDVGVDNCNQTVNIRALNVCGGLSAQLAGAFKYGPDIKITAWGPSQGTYAGGTIVTIYGQGFEAPMTASLAGVAARVVNVSDAEVVVESGFYDPHKVCADHTDVIKVSDINCGVEATGGSFTYKVPPVYISNVKNLTNAAADPTYSGLQGDNVEIDGTGFIAPVGVSFGSANAIVAAGGTDTTIDVTVPPFPLDTYKSQSCVTVGCPGVQYLQTPVPLTVTSLLSGCSTTFNSFYYDPPPALAGCNIPTPTSCTVTSAAGTCSATYSANIVCGAAYAWTDASGGTCVPSTSSTYTCTYATSGTKSVNVTITTSGPIACGGTATIVAAAGCP